MRKLPDDADSTNINFFISFYAGLTESLFLPHKDTYIEYEKVSLRLLYKAKVCPKLLIPIFVFLSCLRKRFFRPSGHYHNSYTYWLDALFFQMTANENGADGGTGH